MKVRKFRLNNPEHPAHGLYFRIRRLEGDHLLAEWCTWSHICTWLFDWDLTKKQYQEIFGFYKTSEVA